MSIHPSPLAALVTLSLGLAPTLHAQTAAVDTDRDAISDEQELIRYHTDPGNADTDGDGVSDGTEVGRKVSPRHSGERSIFAVDSDEDGASDGWEVRLGTDLTNPDSDADGHPDGVEVLTGYDPRTPLPVRMTKVIRVDRTTQWLSYALGDVVLEDFPISSGLRRTPTPPGEYTVLGKHPVILYRGAGYYYPNSKWNLHFATGRQRYFIHGAYWHNSFGRPRSHGCVNVSYANMERLYQFAEVSTRIVIR